MTGSVPDVRDHLAEADLAVAPLRVARGLQNKVLEAMAMALPVVATTAVFEGLDAPGDVGIEVADDPADFASRVITLLREENRRIEAGRRARAYVEGRHRWADHGASLEALLEGLVASRTRPGQGPVPGKRYHEERPPDPARPDPGVERGPALMCGIAGIVELKSGSPERAALERMAALLSHRGPDDQGIAVLGEAGLAHRRLSIIDLSGGHQPMQGEGGASLLFNGEIYNFLEIRAELEAAGHVFTTRSDSEVLLKAYAVWGTDCVARLNGMFAFAIWDAPRRRLFAARDRLEKASTTRTRRSGSSSDRSSRRSSRRRACRAKSIPRRSTSSSRATPWGSAHDPPRSREASTRPLAHARRGRLDVRRYWRPAFRPDDPRAAKRSTPRSWSRSSARPCAAGSSATFRSGRSSRGRRFERGRGDDGRRGRAGREAFTVGFDEAGYSEVEDARGGAPSRDRSPRGDGPAGRDRDPPGPGMALRRAVRRLLDDPDLVRLPHGAPPRDRRPLGRRRDGSSRGTPAIEGRSRTGVSTGSPKRCGAGCWPPSRKRFRWARRRGTASTRRRTTPH